MTTTGTDVIRSALRARKFNLAARAKDLGMPCNALQDFLAGGTLTPAQVCTLALDLWAGGQRDLRSRCRPAPPRHEAFTKTARRIPAACFYSDLAGRRRWAAPGEAATASGPRSTAWMGLALPDVLAVV